MTPPVAADASRNLDPCNIRNRARHLRNRGATARAT